MSLSNKISECQLCLQYSKKAKIDCIDKPYVSFQVEEQWKPEKVNVLFLAESPPWSKQRYFYKTNMISRKTNLQKEVLSYLHLLSLYQFKEKGYFIIDVIKCRLNKQISEYVPSTILTNCTDQFLQAEIDAINPAIIFILGNSAKLALQHLPAYKTLKKHKITENYDKRIGNRRVIFCIYPGGKTRMHIDSIKRSFDKLK